MSEEKYNDIINLPHHVSKKHPQMSLEERSAQFAPFAALTGYEDAVAETERLTDERIDIDEEVKKTLDAKLKSICDKIKIKPEVEITYFIPDNKKDGGKYVTITGKLRRVDNVKQILIMDNGIEISIHDIFDINEYFFDNIDI